MMKTHIQNPKQESKQQKESQEDGMLSPMKILIVDDDQVLAMVVEIMINHLGHEVVAKAANRKEALTAIHEHKLDVILMDIKLDDDIDGITLFKEIREISDIFVIYITSFIDESIYEKAKEFGFIDYLQKPLMVNQLEKAFKKIPNFKISI